MNRWWRNIAAQLPMTGPRAQRNAWIIWGLFFLGIVAVFASEPRRSVTWDYRAAAERWIAGAPLYDDTGGGFIYLPQAAVTFVPYAAMPFWVGEAAWRATAIGLFAAGVFLLVRRWAGPRREDLLFPLVTLATIPLAASAARNGQSTLPMAGAMMLAVSALGAERPVRAAAWLTLAVVIKPLSIVLVLLAWPLHRPVRWPLTLGMIAAVAFPFACQSPGYVWEQYLECGAMLRTAYEVGDGGAFGQTVHAYDWAQLFGMLRVFGVAVAPAVQSVVRLAMALLVLGVTWQLARRLRPTTAAAAIYVAAAWYLMLFNPRTENNTYAMIAPAMALFLATEIHLHRRWFRAGLLAVLMIGTVGSFEIGRLVVDRPQAIWLAPLCSVIFGGYLAARLLEPRPGVEGEYLNGCSISERGLTSTGTTDGYLVSCDGSYGTRKKSA